MVMQIPFIAVNVTALCCYIILFIAFAAAKKNAEIRAFMLVLLNCIFWMGGSVLMRLRVWPGLNFWFYVSLTAIFSMELIFYYFVNTISDRKKKGPLWASLLGTLAIIPGTVSGVFLKPPTPVTLTDGSVVFRYTTDWWIVFPGILAALIIVLTVRLFFILVREQGIKSPGLFLIIIGGIVMLAGNLMQILIPGNTFPYDALAGIVFAGLLIYALYRRRLFRLTLVVSRGLLMIALSAVCVISASNIIIPLKDFLQNEIALNNNLITVCSAFVFAGILAFAYGVLQQLIGAMFAKDEKQNRLIDRFSSEVSQTLKSTEIMEKISEVIRSEISDCCVYICIRENGRFCARYCSDSLSSLSFSVAADSPQVIHLKESDSYLITSEFQNSPLYLSLWEEEKELFRSLKIECTVAMKDGNDVIGLILLSREKQRKVLSNSEICFLQTIASVASIAMKNAGLYEKIYREARIDPLTGCYNYRYFVEYEQEMYRNCQDDSLSLIFIDIDDFKLYNQLYGVEEGDRALVRICEVISIAAGPDKMIFRTSGKVFAVLLPHQDTQRANFLAREISKRIGMINETPERRHMKQLSVSIGICSAPHFASSAAELINNADFAAFSAKQGGKDRIVIFQGNPTSKQSLSEHTQIILDRVERDNGDYLSMLSMISALTAAIDAKDHYTFAHSKNVAYYAANLAVAAGYSDEQVRTIYAAGLLHDIGKISIPEDILNKSGKLSRDEFDTMQGHVNNSIEMIRHLPNMDYLIPAVLGHHEKWNGSGYPRGIAKENIPAAARCLAIADVFDALTTDRPYRKGYQAEYALQEIEKNEGTQFDPALAEIFIRQFRAGAIPFAGRTIEKAG